MSRKKQTELTDLQRETLEEICRYLDSKGFPPTVKELSDVFGVSEPSVYDRVSQLVRKGYIAREGRKARGLTVLRRPEGVPVALASIPVLRKIDWNPDLLGPDNIEDEILVEVPTVRSGTCFALRVGDDGMARSGIRAGDLVIVRQQHLAKNDDIIVALHEDKAWIRRLKQDEDMIELVSDGDASASITVRPGDRFRIIGRIIASKRT